MNPTDLAIAAVAGVVGFGIIWGIFGLIKQQRAAPVDMFKVEPSSSVEGRDKLSLVELGRTWHVILGVSAEATSEEIESGYHARLGECDQIRFSATGSAVEKQDAETRRGRVNEAYEFIRQIKH
jgi:hypothetical protein